MQDGDGYLERVKREPQVCWAQHKECYYTYIHVVRTCAAGGMLDVVHTVIQLDILGYIVCTVQSVGGC